MSARSGLILGALIAALGWVVALNATEPPAIRDTLLRADEARIAAMLSNDLAALDAFLADDCVYVHSNGVAQTKAEFLEALRNGAMRYRAIRYVDVPAVRFFGSAAVLTGTTEIEVATDDGRTLRPTLLITAVYVRTSGAWALASYQSTAAPAR
jgi:uncharacterized protein (TIGR02246 family)